MIDGQGTLVPEARRAPSIAGSLRNLERRLHDGGPRGLPTGTGQQMGALFFDPEGADFTAWINHFKNEVYRNWIVPQPALMGFRGHVDIEFMVERDGTISSLRIAEVDGDARPRPGGAERAAGQPPAAAARGLRPAAHHDARGLLLQRGAAGLVNAAALPVQGRGRGPGGGRWRVAASCRTIPGRGPAAAAPRPDSNAVVQAATLAAVPPPVIRVGHPDGRARAPRWAPTGASS